MKHLEENNKTYFEHLLHAWKVAGILIIHGLLPMVWTTKATDIMCSSDGGVTESTGNRKQVENQSMNADCKNGGSTK